MSSKDSKPEIAKPSQEVLLKALRWLKEQVPDVGTKQSDGETTPMG